MHMATAAKPLNRLFVEPALTEGVAIELAGDPAHYLATVLRARAGDEVLLFNGRDGEWRARLDAVAKRAVTLDLVERTRPQVAEPDLWLAFAPLKKARTDFVVEKAAELGAARVLPVFTARTDAGRVNVERLAATAKEAAEQCERLTVPEVAEAVPLARLLEGWPAERRLYVLSERDDTALAPEPAFRDHDGPAALLIGPEGGFSPAEAQDLFAHRFTVSVRLGFRILRAETAAAAALACFQAFAGDWR
jgi:16S rRNA (uracil1498-N3)-methyltransferase